MCLYTLYIIYTYKHIRVSVCAGGRCAGVCAVVCSFERKKIALRRSTDWCFAVFNVFIWKLSIRRVRLRAAVQQERHTVSLRLDRWRALCAHKNTFFLCTCDSRFVDLHSSWGHHPHDATPHTCAREVEPTVYNGNPLTPGWSSGAEAISVSR